MDQFDKIGDDAKNYHRSKINLDKKLFGSMEL